MKIIILLVLFGSLTIQAQNDYIIEINGKSYEASLNTPQSLSVNGKNVSVLLKKKDTLLFENSYLKFKHLKQHDISSTSLDMGIQQYMMMTAAGSGVIIQTYNDMDPAMLKELMLNEMTKESVGYGYSLKRDDYIRTLSNGIELKVLKAILEYKGEVETFEVASYSKKDEGFLIVTMNTVDDIDVEGKEMIKLVWDTLETN